MSQPNVVEAARVLADHYRISGGICHDRAFNVIKAVNAMPTTTGPCVVVPVELAKCFVDDNPCRFDHHGHCQEHGFIGSPCGVAQLRVLLTAQMPQGER